MDTKNARNRACLPAPRNLGYGDWLQEPDRKIAEKTSTSLLATVRVQDPD